MPNNLKTCYHGRYLHLVERDGWEYVSRLHPVVVMIACTDADELILVEQYRKPVDRRTIELPAGLVGDQNHDRGESLISAATRELIEETGYEAGRMIEIMRCPTSSGMSNEIAAFLMAENLQKIGPGGGDDSEDIAVHCVACSDIDDWLQRQYQAGLCIDPKIYTALYWLQHR
ncbi:MAG: NUDIX hydrolase [Pseudomonadota bacterium]